MSYASRTAGLKGTADYRVFLEHGGHIVSPFYDVPLCTDAADGIFHMIVEIPKGTSAKYEISTSEALHPIRQDVKDGELRVVDHGGGYMCNYGALPQTWEDPCRAHHDTGAFGDGDPLDVCEIGNVAAETGDVKLVKVLGVLAVIDQGETDWKLIAINVEDPLATRLHDIMDVEREKPGYLDAVRAWFRDYKGAGRVTFAFGGEFKPRDYALEVIAETHASWQKFAESEAEAQVTSM